MPDEVIEFSDSEFCHDLTAFFRNCVEEVHYLLRSSFEFRSPLRIGSRNTDWAVVEVALTYVNTTHSDHRDGSEVELLSAEDGCSNDVLTIFHTTISSECDLRTEVVHGECLLCFCETELPWKSTVLSR